MTPAPGLRLGHYQLQEKVGEGGMGIVFKGTDTRLGSELLMSWNLDEPGVAHALLRAASRLIATHG